MRVVEGLGRFAGEADRLLQRNRLTVLDGLGEHAVQLVRGEQTSHG